MIEIYSDFFTNAESDELISYYNIHRNMHIEFRQGVYRFDTISIKDKVSTFLFNDKLKVIDPVKFRIQSVSPSININDRTHTHVEAWTSIVFLNDDFEGGELIVDNCIIKPKKNQLILFTGNEPHMVTPIINGERFTLVSISEKKAILKKNML
jgi:predicted 2-oxoglutarate/Fe(II)-dependent dioxygenase YbiX